MRRAYGRVAPQRREQESAGARSSGGERYIDTVEVIGSKPIVPTIESRLH